MESVKVNYLHLCDAANADSNGKVNILGIFDKVFLTTVPQKFPRFTIVCNLSINNLTSRKENVEFKVLDSKDQLVPFENPIKFDLASLKINEEKLKEDPAINLIVNIVNLEFLSFGQHSINVFLDEKMIGRTLFIVEERKAN